MPESALEACVPAVFRLAMMRKRCPDLNRDEAAARNTLAQAILDYDEAEARRLVDIDEPGASPRRHSFHEAEAVNAAMIAYGQALADLLRGEKP